MWLGPGGGSTRAGHERTRPAAYALFEPRYVQVLCGEDGLPDEAKVRAAVDDMLTRKPHLASRRPAGDVGQGARPAEAGVSLAGLLRAGPTNHLWCGLQTR